MHPIDLHPLYATLNESLGVFLTGLATALAGAVGAWIMKHLKFVDAQTDAAITNAFNTALQNGAKIALNSLEDYEGEHSTVAVKSWVAAKAAQYAIDRNPDFIKRFTGKTPDEIAQSTLDAIQTKALAYVPPVQQVSPGRVFVNGATVTLGKPSPAGMTDEQERAETKALNRGQAKV